MPPTKAALFLPPEMRAEDNFRLSKYPDHRQCLWSMTSTQALPKRWKNNWKFNKRYSSHMNDLSQAFDSPSSPFELKFDPLTGIEVYAKKDVHPQRDYKLVQLLLKGSYSTFESNSQANWSMVSPSISHKKRGRPSSEESGKQVKKTQQTVALIGPINVINHACMKHSQVKFYQDFKSSNSVNIRIEKKIHTGDQVFMSYGRSFNGIKCLKCAARRNKVAK